LALRVEFAGLCCGYGDVGLVGVGGVCSNVRTAEPDRLVAVEASAMGLFWG
jgi:hypothetical protein